MELQALFLRHFRNYEEAFVTFSPGLNVFYGENAQGKTNLLEAVSVLMTGRSFRTPYLTDLVQLGKSSFYIEAYFRKQQIDHVLKISSDGTQRKILLDATPLQTLSALLGVLIGVILSPEDGELIKGNPSERRQFLDLHIAKANPLYLYHLSRYHRAMKQRNVLLKQKTTHSLEVWEEEMAVSSAFLTAARFQAITELNTQSFPLLQHLSHERDLFRFHYKSQALSSQDPPSLEKVRQYYLSQYSKNRKRELDQGSTLFGPHRDDLCIALGENEARYFASEGQQRSCIAALRLAEWSRLRSLTEETPLMCIDDLAISLDAGREEALYSQLAHLGQVFLTTPRPPSVLPEEGKAIEIRNGKCLEPSFLNA